MRVRIDVYSKDVDACLSIFKLAVESNASDVGLTSYEDFDTKNFLYLNLTFDVDHTSIVLEELDKGFFVTDPAQL